MHIGAITHVIKSSWLQVSDILDFVKTVLQFNKLQRVDIGGKLSITQRLLALKMCEGTKGEVLSSSVRKVHEEFDKA